MNRQWAIRALALAVALCGVVARTARAQAANAGRLDGTVTDSVHARPLTGVRVQALGVESPERMRGAATTDSSGQFRIDSLPPGRYMVGFESPLLDSLEMALPPHAVTIEAGRSATVDLAMPPAAKLLAAICPGVALAPGRGAIFGHVVSAETESSAPGMVVAIAWRELGVDRATLRPINTDRTATAITDAGGWYRVCGVPTGTWLLMQLQHEGRTGPVLRSFVGDTLGIAIRHLSFAESTAPPVAAAGESDAVAAQRGTAKLRGVVRDSTGLPVPAAEVRVLGTRASERTDAQGSFSLDGLPAGTQELEVRHVGYAVASLPVELRGGTTTTRDVRLVRVVVSLDSVRVVATRTRYPDFAEHQKTFSLGRFLGPEEIERQRVTRTADIIEKIPGFRIVQRGNKADVMSDRGGVCRVNVVIDGVILKSDDRDAVTVNDVHPSDIGAIEAYREGDQGPAQYDRGCGAIVIWTKR
jgi:hypothetical protein